MKCSIWEFKNIKIDTFFFFSKFEKRFKRWKTVGNTSPTKFLKLNAKLTYELKFGFSLDFNKMTLIFLDIKEKFVIDKRNDRWSEKLN